MISTAFKIEITGNHLLPTIPQISFAGKICSKPEEVDDDCLFGVDLLEYNNFSFETKGKINFKIQIVFEAGPDSRFRKLASRIEIGRSVFITGILDLDDVEVPFVEAKEIDLLDDFVGNQLTNFKTPFSRTQKFKNNRNLTIKKEKISDDEIVDVEVLNDDAKNINNDNNKEKDLKKINDDNIYEIDYINNKDEKESEVTSIKNYGDKRKKVLTDLSLKRLKMTRNDIGQKSNDLIENEIVNINNKKRIATRSQKQKNKEFNYDNNTSNE
jgi:hypothetical protein